MSRWLSILIPVYNVESFVDECLASVLSQALEGVEIIALDDASTDTSLERLHWFAATSSHPIRLLRHERNRGLSAARNTLLGAASGTYVWFVDSDDALAPNAVAELHRVVEANAPDLVLCDYTTFQSGIDASRRRVERHVRAFTGRSAELRQCQMELFRGLYRAGKLHSWSKIAKRELWSEGLRFPEGRNFEDMVTTPRLALRARNWFHAPRPWVRYRRRSGSIVAEPSLTKIEEMSTGSSGVLTEWLKAHPNMDDETRFQFVRFCFRVYCYVLKDLEQLGMLNQEHRERYRRRFYATADTTRFEFMVESLRHGHAWRAMRRWRAL
jgi:glycosyltransferase involved in cell wall biosynthesis